VTPLNSLYVSPRLPLLVAVTLLVLLPLLQLPLLLLPPLLLLARPLLLPRALLLHPLLLRHALPRIPGRKRSSQPGGSKGPASTQPTPYTRCGGA
jgi:hypothetical protein